MVKETILLLCSAVILISINEANGDDWYATLASRAAQVEEKIIEALPEKTDPRTVKKLKQEVTRYIDNFKIVQDKMNTGIDKLKGESVKKTRKAKDKAVRGMRNLEATIMKAERRKNTRKAESPQNVRSVVESMRKSVENASNGVQEFLEAIEGSGAKGIALALDVADAFEKVSDILIGSLAEMS